MKYDFTEIEAKWQTRWAEEKTFRVANPGDPDFPENKPKFYCMDMFPYPSGVGLHVGHPLGFIATDIVARYKRMHGHNVLHPMGFDAFGLPAEQYAIETNVHPRKTTENNIENMVKQLKRLGMAYDWDRSFATTDPGYVKWTQWIFLQLYKSYFDPVEKKARPIEQLVAKLEGEDYLVGLNAELVWSGDDENLEPIAGGRIGPRKWHELEPGQQRRLLDEYRLAYLADVEVNWCPRLGTVLANEEVTADGRSERGDFPVVKRPLKQWMLRITAYADRLIDDLDLVDWPEPIRLLQRNWIGKSLGAIVDFTVDTQDESVTVFTTRPDTLFGATYMVLAPEHPLVISALDDDSRSFDEIPDREFGQALVSPEQREAVRQYIREAQAKTSIDRQADKEKTGVFTGGYATNPVNGESIPIWIADYVTMGYGTGAIMAVPAHDERDHAFATKFGLPIVEVVQSPADHDIQINAWTGDGELVNSANDDITLNAKPVAEAKQLITDWLASRGQGQAKIQYRLRDWLFSRQRYWGEPFPILHGPDGELRAVDEAELPVNLPEMEDFKPTGTDDPDAPPQPPLGRADDDWKKVTIDGVEYTRELNTMPNWAGSCWYYLRYLDPHNDDALVGEAAEKYWMLSKKRHADAEQSEASGNAYHAGGVDLYIGGVEHAVLHLLYARFWHKVLYDLGHVSTPEPFGRLFSQGYIQAYCYRDERGIPVPADEVVNQDGKPAAGVQGTKGQQYFHDDKPVTEEFGKMGKSLKNAVAPDEVCEQYGCDTLRLYEMYLGPLDQSKIWNTNDIVGVHRFLNRLWRNFVDPETGESRVTHDNPPPELDRLTHKTIKRVSDAMDAMQFNVAIAALIELNNALVKVPGGVPKWVGEVMVAMLAPLAPHIAEELWERLGHYVPDSTVADASWPYYDPKMLVEDEIELPVQVNGKMRGKVTVPADAEDDEVIAAAQTDANVATHLEGKTLRKAIVVKGRMVNLVAN
ncbi:MAG: leucine--tRNA ligase [Planctomycetota bacterium]